MESLNFQYFNKYEIEFYEFHDFRDSGVEYIFVFLNFDYSEVELYEFHYFRDSGVEF